MITYGNYELVDELYRTEFGLVGTVRPLDGSDAGDRMVKVFNPTVGDERARAVEAQSFIERARLQRALTQQGAKFWQHIHEVSAAAPGVAYYIADYHPLSAQKLIDARVELKAPALHRIISGAVQGLRELKALRGRPHGDLKPSNVLIVGQGDLRRAKVVLCDPATPSLAASNGENGDLYAIGALIHELVVHRRFDSGTIWPLAPDPAWNQLGRNGKAWRLLCNDLLSPNPRRSVSNLKRVARAIDALSPRRRLAGRPMQIAVLAALLALSFGAYALVGYHERREFCAAHHDWVAAFAAAVAEPARHSRYVADPTLNDVVARVEAINPASVECESGSPFPLTPSEFRRTRTAMSSVRYIEDDLRPAAWERMRLLLARQREFDARAWQQPMSFVSQIVKAARPRPGESLAESIDHLLDLDDAIVRTSPEADAAWGRLEQSCKTLDQTGDVLLIASSHALRASGAAAVSLDLSGLHGLDKLNGAANLGTRLAGAMEDSKTGKVDFTRFAADFGAAVPAASMTVADIETWLGKLDAYRMRHDKVDEAVAELKDRVEKVSGEVVGSNPGNADKTLFEVGRQKVEGRIDQFQQMSFSDIDIEAGALAKAKGDISGDIEKLLQYRRAKSPMAWIRELPALQTNSDRINEYWQSWKRVLPNRLPETGTDNATFDIIKKGTDQLWTALRDLDAAFPVPPKEFNAGDRNPAFAAAARQRREVEIEQILASLKPGPEGFVTEPWKKAGSEYANWLKNLAALAKDFPLRKSLLSVQDRPDLKWAKLNQPFWNDPIIQNLVAPDMLRIRRLDAMKEASREALAQSAQEELSAEVVLAAWKQLGAERIDPPWPGKAGELDAEAKIRRRLSEELKAATPADRAAAEDDLKRQAPIRWRVGVENADAPKTLASALELRKVFAVEPGEYKKLTPEARFNIALYDVRQQLRRTGEGNDAALKNMIEALKQSVGELKGQHGTADLLYKLAGLDRPESFSGEEHGDYFRPQIYGVPMEFKLVNFGDVRPFYLSTREVSFDDFVKVMTAAKLWKNVRSVPLGQPVSSPETVKGPRVWEWATQNATPIALSEFWLAGGERANNFPQSLCVTKFNRAALSEEAGGSPSADHPMQQISAEAAIYFASTCGCRLPTSREWRGACTLFEKDVTADRWNLRDKTWEEYQRHSQTLANPEARSGDNGMFTPAGAPVATGAAAKAGTQDDHTLFFRRVSGDTEAGGTFKHLIGNVAEYVNDAPGQLDQTLGVLALGVTNDAAAEAARAAQIAKFTAAAKDKLGEIGGSALSAPELPIDKMLPLARTDAGYADVGLRLAFASPAKDLAERLRWVLEEQPYLWRASLLEGKDKPADAGAAAPEAAGSNKVAGQ